METITAGQYELIYNAISFGIAAFAAATLFFWFGRSQVAPQYRTAITITGLVTFIALYHYLRIFESWNAAYDVANGVVTPTGVAFNDAYRYVDWLLTVPLLLVELILVMRLSQSESASKSLRLSIAAALMIALGYPGEVSGGINAARLIWGLISMVPFLYIVYSLYVGLGESINRQPEGVRGLVRLARDVTVFSWLFYPVVYFAPFVLPMSSGAATAVIQVGYTIADITSKAIFGLLIYTIAVRKSEAEGARGLTSA
jgi:bacteriorhodopsin